MNKAHGFSLIEVLITIVLVTIGVLGMVAMQSRTVLYTQDSIQRNNAAMLANDLIELIRASPSGPAQYYKSPSVAFATEPSDCSATTQVPANDLACWAKRAKELLPGVTDTELTNNFYICRSTVAGGPCTPAAGSAIEIQLAWTVKPGQCLDAAAAATATLCTYRLRTQI